MMIEKSFDRKLVNLVIEICPQKHLRHNCTAGQPKPHHQTQLSEEYM